MIPLISGRFFPMLCCAVLVVWFASCEKEPTVSLIPSAFDGEAIYTMNGEMRSSSALVSSDRHLPCHLYINVSDLLFGQPKTSLTIDRIELCESIGDTLQVISTGDENLREPGLPVGRYMILNGGDLIHAVYGPAPTSTIQDNYVVITSYDEGSGLIGVSFKLDFRKSSGNDEDFPPTLAIEGELEAFL